MLGRAAEGERGLSPGAGRALAHLLSLARPLLGGAIFVTLGGSRQSALVLPTALAACVSDYFDGPLARASGGGDGFGRLLDGLCDAVFLALALAGMAGAGTWSGPVGAGPGAAFLDLLPLMALVVSFSVYLIRMRVQQGRGQTPGRSALGHGAGIANYGLVLVGAVEAWPGLTLPGGLLVACCLSVAAANVAAVAENLLLLFPRPSSGPTMDA